MAISKAFHDIDHRCYLGLEQLSAALNMQSCKILSNIVSLYMVFHRALTTLDLQQHPCHRSLEVLVLRSLS